MKTSQTPSEKTRIFSLRFSEDEYSALKKLSEQFQGNLSVTIRHLLFKKMPKEGVVSKEKNTLPDAQGSGYIYQKIDRIQADISSLLSMPLTASLLSKKGELSAGEEGNLRRIVAGVDASLRELSALVGHERAIALSSDGDAFWATIRGKVSSDCVPYEDGGEKMMSFNVMVSYRHGTSVYSHTVIVYMKKPESLRPYRRGATVTCSGRLHVELRQTPGGLRLFLHLYVI